MVKGFKGLQTTYIDFSTRLHSTDKYNSTELKNKNAYDLINLKLNVPKVELSVELSVRLILEISGPRNINILRLFFYATWRS